MTDRFQKRYARYFMGRFQSHVYSTHLGLLKEHASHDTLRTHLRHLDNTQVSQNPILSLHEHTDDTGTMRIKHIATTHVNYLESSQFLQHVKYKENRLSIVTGNKEIEFVMKIPEITDSNAVTGLQLLDEFGLVGMDVRHLLKTIFKYSDAYIE